MSTQQQEVITLGIKEDADREEGEIVDEFEYILSSEGEDEETIIKKIQLLEARNDELEKIATISGAGNTYPTDVFEISDYEDDYYSRNVSRGQGKMFTTQNHKATRRRSMKKRRPRRKKKPAVKPRVVAPKPDESASSDSESQEETKVSQDVLRFAVETQNLIPPNKRNLRERLILDNDNASKVKEEDNRVAETEETNHDVIGLDEESIDIEEQELRMMALKSAIMKRHSDRVKRKKESTAYSPSDFDAVCNQSPVVPEEVEGTETPNMDISPIASPASIMSEEDVQPPVDMDIENSEEEEFPIAQFQEEMICSIDNIPKPLPVYQAPENDEEEEEEALRALLLAKMSSPKVIKVKLPAQNDENQENNVGNESTENTAAMILKKAVQRLQEKKKLSCDIKEIQILPVSEKTQKTTVPESGEKVLREKPEENQQRKPQKKIVKPVKRKTEPVVVPVIAAKKPKTSLITSVPNHKVRKLVINLQNSEDEEHELCGDIFTRHFLSTNISLDSENFADAASPSSLLFVEQNSTSSPSTPRSNSPYVTGTDLPPIKKQITNDVFEAKLDSFLKNARSQVEQSAKKEETKKTVQGTPMAVRHLPESSRAEYRKLIKRMELLEKQKQLGLLKLQQSQQKNNVDTIKITIKNNAPKITEPKRIVIQSSSKPAASPVPKKPELKAVVPHVLPKPAVKPTVSETPVTVKPAAGTVSGVTAPLDPKLTAKPAQTPVNKEELFHKVEIQYNKNESLLLENLSKNLVLVETAMISKTRKLELEARLSVLAKEMKTIESDLKEENTKINKIYPQIRFLHKTMEDLKSKRTRLYKYANTLGKTVRNGQISLKDSRRGQISIKYKNLATRMRTLKGLNKDNVVLTKDCSTQVELEEETKEKSNDVEDKDAITISPPSPKKDIVEDAEEEPVPVEVEAATEDDDDDITPLGCEKFQTQMDDGVRMWSNEYVSPLTSTGRSTNTSENLDPNSIICPYALIGCCVDKDCKYNHI